MNCVVVWRTTVRLLLTRTVVCWMRTSTSVPRRLRKVSHGAPAIKRLNTPTSAAVQGARDVIKK